MNLQDFVRFSRAGLAGALLALSPLAPPAQSSPSKPVEFVVHVNPGGGTDVFARLSIEILGKESRSRYFP